MNNMVIHPRLAKVSAGQPDGRLRFDRLSPDVLDYQFGIDA